ncbi:hypothetical protein Agub_g4681, partial [Astrephomene gubernaculifera]
GQQGPGYSPCPAGCNGGSSITRESSYELGFSAQGPSVVFVASEPITASASDWVAVPKNTALVVTREKGGFLNTLRCPLRVYPLLQPSPAPSLPFPAPAALLGAPGSMAVMQPQVPLPRRSSGGGVYGAPPPGLDPQRDVCICLEALSRGITAKSRAFLAHRPTGLGIGGGSSLFLQPSPDTLHELPSLPSTVLGMAPRRISASGQPQQGQPEPAGPAAVLASRVGSQAEFLDAFPDDEPHDYMRLIGHSGPVVAMTVCPHASRLYTSSADCSVKVWSLLDNSCLHTLVGQRKPVTAMRLRAHGRLLLAASGRKIRVWDAVHFRCLQLVKISDSCGTIRCLEVLGLHHNHGRNNHHNHHHEHGNNCHHHHQHLHNHNQDGSRPQQTPQPDANMVGNGVGHGGAAGGGAGGDSARSSSTGEGLLPSPSPRSRRYSSSDGSSSSLSMADVPGGVQEVLVEALGARRGTGGGAAAAVGGMERSSSAALAAGRGEGGAAAAAADGCGVCANGSSGGGGLSLLYVGCQDTTVKVFTLDEHQLLAAAAAAAAPLVSPPQAAAAPAAAGSAPASAAISRLPSMTTPPRSPFAAQRPSLTAAGGLVARTTTTGFAGPPALLPPRIIATPEEADQGVSDLAPLMVTAAEGGAHVGPVNCLALCGRFLCSGGGDATVRVWDAATLKLVGVLRGHRGSVLCLLGLGSNLLLSGARDNTIRVWDLEMDMLCRRTLTGHKDDVTGLAAIHLHKRLTEAAAAAGAAVPDGTTAATGVHGGCLTPGGRSVALASTVVASSSADGTVRLWSTAWTCLCILSLPAASTSPSAVPAALCGCLAADLAVAGFTDGEVRMWHIDDVYGAVLQQCCREVAAEAEALHAACGCLVHGVEVA